MVPTDSADDDIGLLQRTLFTNAAVLEAAGEKAVAALVNTLAVKIRELSFMVDIF